MLSAASFLLPAQVIVAKKLTNYTDPGQFDILLSDYFDVMAGEAPSPSSVCGRVGARCINGTGHRPRRSWDCCSG